MDPFFIRIDEIQTYTRTISLKQDSAIFQYRFSWVLILYAEFLALQIVEALLIERLQ